MDNRGRTEWLREQREEIIAQQSLAIRAKRLVKNKDYKDLIINQLKAEEESLINKLSIPTNIKYGEDTMPSIESVRYIQGQIRTTRGLIHYLDDLVNRANESEIALNEIDEELQSITGQPESDNQ